MENARFPNKGGFTAKEVTLCRPQPENADFPIEVTPLGIVIEVKLLQQKNAYFSMEVTLLGMVTDVKLSQPLKV